MPWEFKAAHDLLQALNTTIQDGRPSPAIFTSPQLENRKPTSLGDFSPIWLSRDLPLLPSKSIIDNVPTDSSSNHSDHYSTDPTSVPDDIEDCCGVPPGVKAKGVRWLDQVDENTDGYKRRFRGRNATNNGFSDELSIYHEHSHSTRLSRARDLEQSPGKATHRRRNVRSSKPFTSSEDEWELDPYQSDETRTRNTTKHVQSSVDISSPWAIDPKNILLVPALVTPRPKPAGHRSIWIPPPSSDTNFDPSVILPGYLVSLEEKRAKLVKELLRKFGAGHTSLMHNISACRPLQNLPFGEELSPSGIHVFVDCSNIVIGFQQALKMARKINIRAFVKQPPFSFQSLALILERGRPAARRVLVGSMPPANNRGTSPKRLDHMVEAEKCGYELNILDRVLKSKDPSPKWKRRGGNGCGYGTSGQSSGSETTTANLRVMAEQGVDEILHMKLLESLVDTEQPSTIVLASGDAAEAEYSGGFLRNVERALAKGWDVEIVAWSAGLSSEYRLLQSSNKHKGQFTIIELDSFSEELLAVYA